MTSTTSGPDAPSAADVDVVVIGAGMAGLSSARWLRAQGFRVLVLESHADLGGQWNRENPNSGVWPAMRTNTARFLTHFSDLDYADGIAMFPRNGEVLDLLRAYVAMFDLDESLRFGCLVDRVGRAEHGGWTVTWTQDGGPRTVTVPRVVVASGRYNLPEIPPIDGLGSFSGPGGVSHAFRYKDPDRYRGQTVVVCGGSISALEIASDLAMIGAEVHLAQRRQRYVMPKMVAGTPIESYVFSRSWALAQQELPVEEIHRTTAERVLRLGGDPTRYGAPAPHADIARAGVTGSPHYLNLVAEDRVTTHPWVARVHDRSVEFTDGTSVEAEAIVVATGFHLNLPFLDDEIRRTIRLTPTSMALADFTFHPDTPGLAFAGLWSQLGPYAVPLEQQARYVAYTWGGTIAAASREELQAAVLAGVAEGHHDGYREQHEMAIRFGRLAGVDPADVDDPELAVVLPFATVTADTFRLVGPDAAPDAGSRVLRDFWRYGTPEDREHVRRRLQEMQQVPPAPGPPVGSGDLAPSGAP
ncbi:NAD(P)/FAD-dependent oxidoreductase [Phycicoccus sp. DTK01]|uniref:flavin-containing monooxygenase n=1 Tax=Phycicoccus sp. DTK01 TaxID=2785745 RepID=UPI001A904DC3|nr:NAD(P)/FAD-dependent oxidoreductase [Phycicoccus sp. DTK01]GIL36717.1 monooxygenase [Phycicoccus sp. DTK01]